MAAEVELQRMVVRLLGDSASFERMIRMAKQQVREAANVFKSAGAKIEAVKGQIDKFARSLQSLGGRIRSVGTRLSLFITTPLVALGGASVKAAIDAEETASKFSVVFGHVIDDANKMAEELDKNYGLAGTQTKRLLSDTADLLSGFGFTQERALELSGQVQKLAVDLASFTNVQGGAERASMAITKGLLGERESMKLLGIAINQTTDQWKSMMKEVEKTTGLTGVQAQAEATLRLATLQSKNAIGDYARTSSSAANTTRELGANIQDLREEIGILLIPAYQKLVALSGKLIAWLRGTSTGSKRLGLIIAVLAAAVGPLVVGLGIFISSLGTIVGLITPLLTPVGLLTAGIVALGVKLFHHFGNAGAIVEWFGKQWTFLKERFDESWKAISDAIAAGDLKLATEVAWMEVKVAWEEGLHELRQLWLGFQTFILETWFKTIKSLESGRQGIIQKVAEWIAVRSFEVRGGLNTPGNLDRLNAELKEINRMGGLRQAGLDKGLNKRLTEIQEEAAKRARTSQRELNTMKKERDAIREVARSAAEEAKQAAPPGLPKSPTLPGINDLAKVGKKTVQARQAASFGSLEHMARVAEFRAGTPTAKGDPAKDTKNLDDMKKDVRKMVEILRDGFNRATFAAVEIAGFE